MRVFRNRLLASVLGAGVSLLLAASQAGAQPPSSDSRINVVINGAVNVATRVGNTLYLGGSFSRIAPSTNAVGSLVAVNPTTATGDTRPFPSHRRR